MKRLALLAALCPLAAAASLTFSTGPEVHVGAFLTGTPANEYQLNLRVDPHDADRMTITGKNGRENHTVAFSTLDGGATWNFTRQLNSGDPDNTYDLQGGLHWMHMDRGVYATSNYIGYRRSLDGGLTWAPSQIISSLAIDHPHMVEDRAPGSPWLGSLYIAGRQPNAAQLGVLRSRDRGTTWQESVFPAGSAIDLGFVHHPAALADGTLVVPVKSKIRILTDANGSYAGASVDIYVLRSTDGGVTFGAPIFVNDMDGVAGAGPGESRSFSGVHVVPWAGGERLMLVISRKRAGLPSVLELCTSDDGGLTWSAPRTIHPPSPANFGAGAMGAMVNPDGVFGIQYYNQAASPDRFHLYFTASADGGRTFTNPLQVSSALSYQPPLNQQPREPGGDQVYGDAAPDGSFRLVWTNNRDNTNDYTAYHRSVVPTLTLPPLASAPAPFTATTAPSGVTLAWNTISGSDAYEMQARAVVTHPWIRAAVIDGPENTAWTDASLLPGQTRRYRVRAHNLLNASPWSEEIAYTAPVPPLPAATARWRFDAASGTVAVEDTAPALDLTLTGSPAWTTEGRIEGALVFNGTGHYARTADHALLDGAPALSLSLWVYPTVLNGTPRFVVSKRDGTHTPYSVFFYTGNRLYVDINRTNANNQRFASTTTFQTARWYHLAVVFDGALPAAERLRLYVDGQLDSTHAVADDAIARRAGIPLSVGTANVGSTQYFAGRLDDLRLFRAALASSQALLLANPPPPGSLAAWRERHFNATQLADPQLESTLWGDAAVPSADGTPNLLKYHLGLAPLVPVAPENLPRVASTISDESLSIAYWRSNYTPSVSAAVEWSEDLAAWFDSDVTNLVTDQAGDRERIEASVPLDGRPRLFLRLRVSAQ